MDFAGDAILTTEKDAVKLARLRLPLPVWVLPVTAEVKPDLAAFVLEKLNGRPPA
jgi:tetraacyldisaccharide 4'-kinase